MAEKKQAEPAELAPGQRLADGELRARGIDPQDPEKAHSREELAKIKPGDTKTSLRAEEKAAAAEEEEPLGRS